MNKFNEFYSFVKLFFFEKYFDFGNICSFLFCFSDSYHSPIMTQLALEDTMAISFLCV